MLPKERRQPFPAERLLCHLLLALAGSAHTTSMLMQKCSLSPFLVLAWHCLSTCSLCYFSQLFKFRWFLCFTQQPTGGSDTIFVLSKPKSCTRLRVLFVPHFLLMWSSSETGFKSNRPCPWGTMLRSIAAYSTVLHSAKATHPELEKKILMWKTF